MAIYRRSLLPGGTFFFTVTLRNRQSTLLSDHVGLLREAFRSTIRRLPFTIEAVVVLPDHLHTIWTLPPGDAEYPKRWSLLKTRFTRSLKRAGLDITQLPDGGFDVWQRRYWEHTIRDERDLAAHFDYIHFNPVKHGLVERVRDWPFSSFHRFVREGRLAEDWGGGLEGELGLAGE